MVVRPQHFRSHRTAPVPRESEASGPTMDIRAFIRPGPARFAALQQDRVHNGVVQQSICPLARAYIAAVVLLHNSKQRSSAGRTVRRVRIFVLHGRRGGPKSIGLENPPTARIEMFEQNAVRAIPAHSFAERSPCALGRHDSTLHVTARIPHVRSGHRGNCRSETERGHHYRGTEELPATCGSARGPTGPHSLYDVRDKFAMMAEHRFAPPLD
jgi:hypothetical protein